jgi:crotonobetainyl-CoA:carnitine CoA-transferase CaiB-like acyl-CoA transferase
MPDNFANTIPIMTNQAADFYLAEFWQALGGAAADLSRVSFTGTGSLPSVFPVTDLAASSIAAAGLAVAELIELLRDGYRPSVTIDRRLASFWFNFSLRPQGWDLPPVWDAIAGDYPASDGWIRLHTNAPHHRRAALSVLGLAAAADKTAVAAAVARWQADDLESAVVAAGGCAATMRSQADWMAHPQGRAVGLEPLLHQRRIGHGHARHWQPTADRPLAGLRVLDLTRILAGPTATRFLAGYGAEVLRIDPPLWDEPSLVPELTPGKRCARLDLRQAGDRELFERLLAGADILVHGYRADALAGLGLGADRRREINPLLVDVCLDAYGWSGPWQARRGFDSLVQMSTGIAEAGMRRLEREKPTPLPVQALDCATGYLLAAAAIRGILQRQEHGCGIEMRSSLARMARLLTSLDRTGTDTNRAMSVDDSLLAAETADDLAPVVEATCWGSAYRLKPPLIVAGTALQWSIPAGPLGAAEAAWS